MIYLKKITEENKLTPKEYTLKMTNQKYDTIFVSSYEVEEAIKRNFGKKLNVIVNRYLPDQQVIMYDSRQQSFIIEDGE